MSADRCVLGGEHWEVSAEQFELPNLIFFNKKKGL